MRFWDVFSNRFCSGCILNHTQSPQWTLSGGCGKVSNQLCFIKGIWQVQGKSPAVNSATGVDGKEEDIKYSRSYTRTLKTGSLRGSSLNSMTVDEQAGQSPHFSKNSRGLDLQTHPLLPASVQLRAVTLPQKSRLRAETSLTLPSRPAPPKGVVTLTTTINVTWAPTGT